MSEMKTLGRITVITDTENGYDRIGEVSGSFGWPPDELLYHVRKYGHAEVLDVLARMTAQVIECANAVQREKNDILPKDAVQCAGE